MGSLDKRQQELIKVAALTHKNLDAQDGQGIVALATGIGKTKIGIDYIYNKAQSVLWVVPTETLRDDVIPAEFSKWGKGNYFDQSVTTICYASLPSVRGQSYDYVVLDEAHRLTDLKYSFFTKNIVGKLICLTATPPDEPEKKHLLMKVLGLKIVIDIGPEEAADRELVAPFDIQCIGVTMGQTRDVLLKNGSYTSERAAYNYWDRKCKNYQENHIRIPQRVALARMRAVHSAKNKIKAAKELVDTLGDSRLIIFSSTIKNAEFLGKHVFHSKTNKEDYNRFNNKEINQISVVKSVDEGVNLVDVDIAVITQVYSNKRSFIQRLGRVIRFRENHQALVYVFYYKNTMDETWLENSLEDISNKHITYTDFEIFIKKQTAITL